MCVCWVVVEGRRRHGSFLPTPPLNHRQDTICSDAAITYGEGACGMWVMLFIFSKVPELVDTVFIVFRKSVRRASTAAAIC